MKKIIGFAGSTSSTSINKQFVAYVTQQLNDVSVELLDLNDFEMPIYSADREKNTGIPKEAHAFREKLHSADGIVCSLAEHNRSYTAAFKNIFDWCSRVDMNIFNECPMLLLSTSPGGFGGGNVMAAAQGFFPKTAAKIIDTFSLPKFYDNFKDGQIINEHLNDQLMICVKKFQEEINK